MSSDLLTTTVPFVVILAACEIGFVYAGYISLSVWRGLSVPIYRSRAKWTGILSLLIGLALPSPGGILSTLFPSGYLHILPVLVYIFLYPGVFLGLLAWIDRTIATLITMDYLRRDIARWRSLRWAYWASTGLQFITYYLGYFINFGGFFNSSSTSNIVGLVYVISLLFPIAYGTIALLVGSRRTANLTFRTQAKWLGYAMGGLVIVIVVSQLPTSNIVIGIAPALLLSYSFYKIARYLVPVGRLHSDMTPS